MKNLKINYVGNKKLIDLETGEEFEAQTIIKHIGDKDFKKIFITEVLERIEEFSGAKMKFIFWIFNNVDKQNRIIGSHSNFSKSSNVSLSTVSRVIPILIKSKILKRLNPSVYMIDPNILTMVNSDKRGNLLVKYNLNDHEQ